MSAFIFDSHTHVKRLQVVGFTELQAEAIVRANCETLEQLVTKEDIKLLQSGLDKQFTDIKLEIILWLGGIVITASTAVSGVVVYMLHLLH